MIKTHYKRAATVVAVFALLVSALPASALVRQIEVEANPLPDRGLPVYENACSRITNVSPQLQARLDDLRTKLNERRDERKTALVERREDHRDKAADRREAWTERWDKMISDLRDDATTDAQRAVIAQFKTEMQAAFNARKSAVEAANAAFRTGLDKAVEARKTSVQKAVETLRTTVKTLFAKAAADCTANVPSATVQTQLKAGLEAAHAKFRTDMQAVDKVGADAKTLAETRNAAVRKAHADFKVAAEKARSKLKAALEQLKESASNTNAQ